MSSDFNVSPPNYHSPNPPKGADGNAPSSTSSSQKSATESSPAYMEFTYRINQKSQEITAESLKGRGKVHKMIDRALSKIRHVGLKLLRPVEEYIFGNFDGFIPPEEKWIKNDLDKAKKYLKNLKSKRSKEKDPLEKAKCSYVIYELRNEINYQRMQLKFNSNADNKTPQETGSTSEVLKPNNQNNQKPIDKDPHIERRDIPHRDPKNDQPILPRPETHGELPSKTSATPQQRKTPPQNRGHKSQKSHYINFADIQPFPARPNAPNQAPHSSRETKNPPPPMEEGSPES